MRRQPSLAAEVVCELHWQAARGPSALRHNSIDIDAARLLAGADGLGPLWGKLAATPRNAAILRGSPSRSPNPIDLEREGWVALRDASGDAQGGGGIGGGHFGFGLGGGGAEQPTIALTLAHAHALANANPFLAPCTPGDGSEQGDFEIGPGAGAASAPAPAPAPAPSVGGGGGGGAAGAAASLVTRGARGCVEVDLPF